jgi:hypothetical protein
MPAFRSKTGRHPIQKDMVAERSSKTEAGKFERGANFKTKFGSKTMSTSLEVPRRSNGASRLTASGL